MKTNDYNIFHDAWVNAHAMSCSNQTPSNSVISAVFDVLSEYSLENVIGALSAHSKKSKFAPTPADICELIDSRSGSKHIGADEAWGIALASFDESATVIITQEIAAARELVMDIYESGDTTGARMAFRESYTRIIATAGNQKWYISPGTDRARRVDAITRAIDLGRLPKKAGGEYLVGEDKPTVTVTGLIESSYKKSQNSDDKEFREKALRNIGSLKAMLAFSGDDGVSRRESERLESDRIKSQKLDDYYDYAAKESGLH